jgi:hypothetical protein
VLVDDNPEAIDVMRSRFASRAVRYRRLDAPLAQPGC